MYSMYSQVMQLLLMPGISLLSRKRLIPPASPSSEVACIACFFTPSTHSQFKVATKHPVDTPMYKHKDLNKDIPEQKYMQRTCLHASYHTAHNILHIHLSTLARESCVLRYTPAFLPPATPHPVHNMTSVPYNPARMPLFCPMYAAVCISMLMGRDERVRLPCNLSSTLLTRARHCCRTSGDAAPAALMACAATSALMSGWAHQRSMSSSTSSNCISFTPLLTPGRTARPALLLGEQLRRHSIASIQTSTAATTAVSLSAAASSRTESQSPRFCMTAWLSRYRVLGPWTATGRLLEACSAARGCTARPCTSRDMVKSYLFLDLGVSRGASMSTALMAESFTLAKVRSMTAAALLPLHVM
mmetsp:Transcript_21390/g.46830  ORF Transcript_21390/g.46830 Transcript_21390/m.46830 type:complete len:359 (-) Transcript_21390:860-1936(-)